MNSTTLPTGASIDCFQSMETELIIDEIFKHQVYPIPEFSDQHAPLIVDVGANIGVFTHYVMSKYPQATVHAVEPVPPIAEVLQRNTSVHGANVQTHVLAIAGQEGESQITFYPGYSIMSRLEADQEADEGLLLSCVKEDLKNKSKFKRALDDRHVRAALGDKLSNGETYPCKLVTLAKFLEDQNITCVDYLKLDAEGSEKAILECLPDAVWPVIRAIGIEVHEYGSDPKIVTILETLLAQKGFQTRVGHQTGEGATHTIMLYGSRLK